MLNRTLRSYMVRATLTYVAMALGAALLFLLFRSWGERLTPHDLTSSVGGAAADAGGSDVLWHVLLALAAVVVVGRVLGHFFRRIGQPPVIGEVVAGILLGPSLLGRVSPALSLYILPPDVAPFLGVIAQLGVIVYMFIIGLELNPDILRGQVQATIATSHASIVVPFVLGSALALYLYPGYSPASVPFTNFALFLGVAMSITAFPVLARILADNGMMATKLGALALTCAAVDDVTAWCLLAFVVAVVQTSGGSALIVSLFTAGFIALMFLVVRPVFRGLARSSGDSPKQGVIALALVSMLLAALTTEAIGIHAIFGAFLLGAVIPHESGLARSLKNGLGDLVTILFLPAFFAFTGMRTQIGLLENMPEWWVCGLIVAVATIGKCGGAAVAARVSGLDWRHAAGLGVLMNTRGLMELIVLNVGLDLGVITPTLFTMMVVMALVTTLATTPALRRLGLINEPVSAPRRVRPGMVSYQGTKAHRD
jgi:Kef-type K+ transport system membrane component KefB